MASGTEKPAAESSLLTELADVERRIADLERERAALQRLITKVRQQNLTAQDVTRRNSFDRILAESKILELLGKTEKYVRVAELYREARLVNYNLKDTTFRSYMHRLREKGLIEPSSTTRGFWRLVRKPAS
jgi:hypothetical protein